MHQCKYKAGDKIRRRSQVFGRHNIEGTLISQMAYESACEWKVRVDKPLDHQTTAGETRDYQLCTLSDLTIEILSSTQTQNPMNILNYIKRIGLTADDKALLDAGLEDPSSVPTSTGIDVLNKILWKEKRAEIAKLAKEMLEEEKAEKKG